MTLTTVVVVIVHILHQEAPHAVLPVFTIPMDAHALRALIVTPTTAATVTAPPQVLLVPEARHHVPLLHTGELVAHAVVAITALLTLAMVVTVLPLLLLLVVITQVIITAVPPAPLLLEQVGSSGCTSSLSSSLENSLPSQYSCASRVDTRNTIIEIHLFILY